MKKLVCILVLICIVIGAAFAQAKPAAPAPAKPAAASSAPSGKVNALGLDVFQLVEGAIKSNRDIDYSVFTICVGYERLISPHFTLGAALDMVFISYKNLADDKKDDKYFKIVGEGRYYPMSENFEKFFLGATLGYCQYSCDGSTKLDRGGYSGLSTSLKMGYKVITAKGLYIEPALAYLSEEYHGNLASGWEAGLRLGWTF